MNKGKQLIIALAFLAMLIIIAFQLRSDPFEQSGRQDYSTLLSKRMEGSIDKIVVKNKESSLTVEKRQDAWWITEPRELSADENGLKPAVSFLEHLTVADIASKKKERQSEYGLKDNPERVDVKAFSKGAEVLSFAAGKVTADFKGSFILLALDPETVYSTSEPMPALFLRGVKDWRSKFIVDIDELERIRIFNPKGALELEKDAQGNWGKKDDPAWKTDANRLNQLIATLSKFAWAEVVDDPDPAVSYGFEKPQARISLIGKGKEYMVIVGKEVDQPKGNTWIQALGDPKIYQVRKAQVEKITRDWDYYRENQPEAKEEAPPPSKAEIKPKQDTKGAQPKKGKR